MTVDASDIGNRAGEPMLCSGYRRPPHRPLQSGRGMRPSNTADTGPFQDAQRPAARVGARPRRLPLDELPQLINVLRDGMSRMGSRPLIAEEDRPIQGWDGRRLRLTGFDSGQSFPVRIGPDPAR